MWAKRCASAAFLVVLLGAPDGAQADFVESSRTLGADRSSFELRVYQERDRAGNERRRSTATPMVFVHGLADRWDLRVETDGLVRAWSRVDGGRVEDAGMADLSIGVTHHVRGSGEGSRPSIGWLFDLVLPTGSTAFRGQGLRPSLRFVSEWALGDHTTLGLMPGVAWQDGPAGRVAVGLVGVLMTRSFSERFDGFAEVALPRIAGDADGGMQARFDLGGSWRPRDGLQWDLVVYTGLNDRTPNLGIATGIVIDWKG